MDWATSPSSSATSTCATAVGTIRSAPRGAPRSTRPRCCTAGRWSPATPSTTCPTTGSSTSPATSCPAPSPASCACTASTSRWPSARTSGRRAARSPRSVMPGPGCWWSSTDRPTRCTRTTPAWRSPPRRAVEADAVLAYVNMVGGQDELVFDGDSLVVGADGQPHRPGTAVRRAPPRARPRPAGGQRQPHHGDQRRAAGPVSGQGPRADRAPARRRGRDVRRAGRGPARLRAQERVPRR